MYPSTNNRITSAMIAEAAARANQAAAELGLDKLIAEDEVSYRCHIFEQVLYNLIATVSKEPAYAPVSE